MGESLISRRAMVKGLAATSLVSGRVSFGGWRDDIEANGSGRPGWTAAWSRAALEGALAGPEQNYDPAEHMVSAKRGPEYNYQSTLRSMVVHPVRDAFDYALLLLELNRPEPGERAFKILERTLELQDKDEKSKWFGLWSYYLEEPLPKMAAVDFNWADFNGSTLLLILFRHGARVPAPLKAAMMEAIGRAAESIRRRSVSVYYTNIIAQGTFVVLGYAEMANDPQWLAYGRDRLRRWADVVDESGSFAEYNSSAYTSFLLEIMARISSYVRDEFSRSLSSKLERRAWDHFSAHWHAPTMQLAGPMARCYHNDIGSPLWLQKSLNNEVVFETLDEIPRKGGSLPAAILDFRCPAEFKSRFVALDQERVHREVFISGNELIDTLVPLGNSYSLEPVQGTTLLTPKYALGSANRSDFWVQRRPLLAYWGGRERPPHTLQMRVIKDDYDFSSAVFHSVQDQGAVLGVVGFRDDGGDKHPLIDRIQDGQFQMQTMRVEVQFGNWSDRWVILANGEPLQPGKTLRRDSRVVIETEACHIGLQFRWADFHLNEADAQPYEPVLAWTGTADGPALRLTLYDAGSPRTVKWKDVGAAGCALTMQFSDRDRPLREFDKWFAEQPFSMRVEEQGLVLRAGRPELGVSVQHRVASYVAMESSFHSSIAGKPVPSVRLSEAKLLA